MVFSRIYEVNAPYIKMSLRLDIDVFYYYSMSRG